MTTTPAYDGKTKDKVSKRQKLKEQLNEITDRPYILFLDSVDNFIRSLLPYLQAFIKIKKYPGEPTPTIGISFLFTYHKDTDSFHGHSQDLEDSYAILKSGYFRDTLKDIGMQKLGVGLHLLVHEALGSFEISWGIHKNGIVKRSPDKVSMKPSVKAYREFEKDKQIQANEHLKKFKRKKRKVQR